VSPDAFDVSVVVPLLDEEATAEELVARVGRVLATRGCRYEIVLVDDGSRDRTREILRRLETEDPAIRVFELTRNFGQAAALVCGLFAARGAVVVSLDGDLQNPPEEIPKLLDALDKGAEIATGRRVQRYEGFARWLGSRAIHWMARHLTGVEIADFGGQFKAYRRVVLDATLRAWAPGKPFFPLALWLGFSVAEVDVRHEPRRAGRSRYSLRALLHINLDLVTAFTTLPLSLLGFAGAVLTAAGLVGTALCLALSPAGWLPAAASLTLVAVGALFLATGVLGQYLGRVYRQVAGGGPAFVVRSGPRRDAE
jgi:undecaprenyl-phosphate 4-deoxy-4-formamido-L-arabinose transferase